MGTGFHWQTEAEEWVEQPPAQRPARRPLFLLLALLILLLPAGVVYRQVQRQVDEATARALRSVESSHSLIVSPAAAADEDLLRSFLSGRDRRWTYDTLALAGQERLFDYPELGLRRIHERPEAPATPQITLAPDLRSAEVTAEMSYMVESADGLPGTVYLEQTFVYRLGADRWLWSPPEADFWGERVVTAGGYLSANHPERDKEVVERMLADFDLLIGRMCRINRLDCAVSEERPVIEFGTDPFDLLAIERGRWPPGNIYWLPTPSLLGHPTDEAAYLALYQGYARRVLPPLIADQVGWSCCQHGAFFEAVLAWQLNELGLAPWPVAASDYESLWQATLPLAALADHWEATAIGQLEPHEQREVYTLVNFLLADSSGPPASDLQRALAESQTFAAWLAIVAGPNADEGAWRLFLFQRSTMAEREPPFALPDQEALVQCARPGGYPQRYSYNPALNRWSPMPHLPPLGQYTSIYPFLVGFLVQESQWQEPDGEYRITYWRSGIEQPLFEQHSSNPLRLYVSSVDPVRSRAVLTTYNPVTNVLENQLFDPTFCGRGACGLTDLPGFVQWSPNGQRTLLTVYGEAAPALYLGDPNGEIQAELGTGSDPVWLDNETYGYFGQQTDGDSAFMVRRLPDNRTLAMLEDSAFWRTLPEYISDLQASRFSFGGSYAHAKWPGMVLISLYDAFQNGTRLFSYEWPEGVLDLHTSDADHSTYPRFSPDGQWLALYEQAFGHNMTDRWRLYLYRQEGGTRQPAGPATSDFQHGPLWSRDSLWLFRSDGELVYLTAPGSGYQEPLLSPSGACDMAFWIER